LSEPQALVSVAAEDALYRALHVSAVDGDRVTRAAFLTNGQYDRELSVHLAKLLTSPADCLRDRPWFGVGHCGRRCLASRVYSRSRPASRRYRARARHRREHQAGSASPRHDHDDRDSTNDNWIADDRALRRARQGNPSAPKCQRLPIDIPASPYVTRTSCLSGADRRRSPRGRRSLRRLDPHPRFPG
jgi:hypothetical protein